jgi:hypothetical protein
MLFPEGMILSDTQPAGKKKPAVHTAGFFIQRLLFLLSNRHLFSDLLTFKYQSVEINSW